MPNPLSSHFRGPLFHLSSLMNRCCSAVGVNMMDWVAGRHILLLGESERGHLDTEQHAGVPWLFCISHLFPNISLTSYLTFKCLSIPEPHPQALYHPLSCPSEPLSDILFDWLLTCNVPLSTTGEARRWKGQNIYNKVKSLPRGEEGKTEWNSSWRNMRDVTDRG